MLNRDRIFATIQEQIDLGADGKRLAVQIVRVRGLRDISLHFGWERGEQAVEDARLLIEQSLRPVDRVFRSGDESFTVILPDIAGREEAEAVAMKIIAALATPFQLGSQKQSVDIGTSIGIAVYPADARDADALVKAADAAMYSAKQAGNSFRYCVA